MANMTFKINLLPDANNTRELGSSSARWKFIASDSLQIYNNNNNYGEIKIDNDIAEKRTYTLPDKTGTIFLDHPSGHLYLDGVGGSSGTGSSKDNTTQIIFSNTGSDESNQGEKVAITASNSGYLIINENQNSTSNQICLKPGGNNYFPAHKPKDADDTTKTTLTINDTNQNNYNLKVKGTANITEDIFVAGIYSNKARIFSPKFSGEHILANLNVSLNGLFDSPNFSSCTTSNKKGMHAQVWWGGNTHFYSLTDSTLTSNSNYIVPTPSEGRIYCIKQTEAGEISKYRFWNSSLSFQAEKTYLVLAKMLLSTTDYVISEFYSSSNFSSTTFLTNTRGTGDWAWYVYTVKCTADTTNSTSNYNCGFRLLNNDAEILRTYYINYYNVIDITGLSLINSPWRITTDNAIFSGPVYAESFQGLANSSIKSKILTQPIESGSTTKYYLNFTSGIGANPIENSIDYSIRSNPNIYIDYQSSEITLHAPSFYGNLTGNATTATTATGLASAPTLEAAGTDPIGLAANTTYTLTVGGKSVVFKTPPNTNTTYTFAGKSNGFTVTSSGGTTQTVTVTPSITNNITGSGTNGSLVKFNGTNTITSGPALSTAISSQTQSTKFLREDGTWAAPSYTTNADTKVKQNQMDDSYDEYSILITSTSSLTNNVVEEAGYATGVTLNPYSCSITATTFKGNLQAETYNGTLQIGVGNTAKIQINKKLILTENVNWGTNTPSSPVEGQLFFVTI